MLENRSLRVGFAAKQRTSAADTLALSVEQCETIATEALDGEERLAVNGKSSARLIEMLGFKKENGRNGSIGPNYILPSANDSQTNEVEKKIPKLPKPVGRPKPKRDPTGPK